MLPACRVVAHSRSPLADGPRVHCSLHVGRRASARSSMAWRGRVLATRTRQWAPAYALPASTRAMGHACRPCSQGRDAGRGREVRVENRSGRLIDMGVWRARGPRADTRGGNHASLCCLLLAMYVTADELRPRLRPEGSIYTVQLRCPNLLSHSSTHNSESHSSGPETQQRR